MRKFNVKLSEIEYRRLEGKAAKAGVSKSELMRRLINTDGNVEIRYDAAEVIRQLPRIQESVNKKCQFVLDEIDAVKSDIEALKSGIQYNAPMDKPIPVKLAEMEAQIEGKRLVVTRVEEKAAKEMDEKLASCRAGIAEGQSPADALSESGLFSNRDCRLLKLSERTGSLPETLETLAARQEEESLRKIDRLVGAIEPAIVVITSVLAGVILISVMLPLMGLLSAAG